LKINMYPESLLINKLKWFLIQFIKKYQTQYRYSDAALKKNHVNYVLQINTNIKFTIKYTPFSTQRVLERDALR
jgi:hypothetical protein